MWGGAMTAVNYTVVTSDYEMQAGPNKVEFKDLFLIFPGWIVSFIDFTQIIHVVLIIYLISNTVVQ